MDDTHLPDPPPPEPPPSAVRHPMIATGGIVGGVLAVCILLAIISML